MTEEYIYKIVLDDAELNRVVTALDTRIENLAKRADTHFRNVGQGISVGLRQAVATSQQASRQIQQTEQQTGQQIQRTMRSVVSASVSAAQERARAAQQAAQAEVSAAKQVVRERQKQIKEIDDHIKSLENLKREAEESAESQKERVVEAARAQERALEDVIDARRRLAEAAGAGAPAISMAQLSASQAAAREKATVGGIELSEEQAALSETQATLDELNTQLRTSAELRQDLGKQAAEAARTQQEAEEQLGQVSRERVDANIQGLQNEIDANRAVVSQRQEALDQAKQEVENALLRRDAAKDAAAEQKQSYAEAREAVKSAVEAEKAAIEELKTVRESGDDAAIARAEQQKELASDQVQIAQEQAEAEKAAVQSSAQTVKAAEREVREARRQSRVSQQELTKANLAQRESEKLLRSEKQALAKQEREAVKNVKDANREFIRTTKTYNTQRNELHRLAQEHGKFNVVIGKTQDEMNDLEKEVNDVIRSDKQLSDTIDEIVAKRGKFTLGIDRATFAGGRPEGFTSTQLRQAGFAAQRLGVPGAAALGEAAAVGGGIGIAVAGSLLTIKALTNALKAAGQAALEAFENIISGAVEAAKEIELAEAQFTAFFEGDTRAAEAALQRLRDLSVELGENVVGIGRAFLPEVENLDQLEQVVKIATALARFQPEQGALGARIALQEALAGEFRSLQRRFEISPVAIDRIREAFETSGVTGLLEELQAELERTGRSVEDLSDTFSVSMGKIQERLRQVQAELGAPLVEELGDQFKAIDRLLEELSPDLSAVANAFGEILARLAEIIGLEVQNFLREFDPEPLFEVADATFRVVDAIGIMLTGINAGAGAAGALEGGLHSLTGVLLSLEGGLLRTSLSIAQIREDLARLLPLIIVLNDVQEFGLRNLISLPGTDILADLSGTISDITEGFLAEGASVEEVTKLLEGHEQRVKDFNEGLMSYTESLKESKEEGEDAANTYITMTKGLDQLIVIQKDYLALQEEINEAIQEFDVQANLRFEKLLTDAARKRLDAEIANAEKLIDIDRNNKRKIADIRSKYDLDVIASAVSLGDKEADIARKNGRALAQLEDDINDERLEVEENYQNELERLRDKFNFDAFEAILANDAKRLRQIRRRQAFEESQLEKDRNQELDDVNDKADDRREALQRQLEQEIEDARIANARKLRDLTTALTEQLAKQEEARKRDVEDQAIAERRKRAELKQQLDDSLEDYNDWWEERRRITNDKTAEDLATLRQYITDAMKLMRQLSLLGIRFNPLTGQPEFSFSRPTIEDPVTGGVRRLQERVIELSAADEFVRRGESRPREEIRADIEALSVEDLVKELDRLQRALEIQDVDPKRFIETQDLALKIMQEQAVSLGRQVGVDAKTIADQVVGLSLRQLGEWIEDFIAKYSVPELPEFSIFGPSETGIPGLPGPMSVVTPGTPGAPFMFPPGPQSTLPGVTGQEQFGLSIFGTAVPPLPSGQTIYTFPNVTDTPYVAAPWTGYPATGLGGVPSFGEAITAQPGQLAGAFGAGAFPPNPAAGFDTQAFMDMLDAQIDSQIAAELIKRGEIEDTTQFSALLAEEQALAIAALKNEEVQDYQTASDAEISILENTIAAQEETLKKLRENPELDEEAKAVEAALDILKGTLERKQAELAEANQVLLDQETAATLDAEKDKQDAIDETLYFSGQAAYLKALDYEAGTKDEVKATEKAEADKTTALGEGTDLRGVLEETFRGEQLELDAEHQMDRAELADDANYEMLKIANAFWKQWIRENDKGIKADLRQLQQWLAARQQLITSATTAILGGGTVPGTPTGSDTTTSNVATEAQLENLATSLAEELGILTPVLQGDIMDMSYQELVDFITYLQNELGYRALGGGFQPYQPLIVGEQGPEIASFGAAGRITPLRDYIFKNMVSAGAEAAGTTINYNMESSVSFPDPRGIPPSYLRAMENIAVRVAKRSLPRR